MLILFDHGAPRGVARVLRGHIVITAQSRGWERLTNGALLKAAEEALVDVLFTTDQRIRYQQNLTGRKIALAVLAGTTKWSRVRLHLERIAAAVHPRQSSPKAAKSSTWRRRRQELFSDSPLKAWRKSRPRRTEPRL